MISVDNIKQRAQEHGVSQALIFKECVHVVVLDYLFKKGLFSHLVFQGGTALRLFYQGLRYSEDLDFVMKAKDDFAFAGLGEGINSLPGHLLKFIPFVSKARLKAQKETGFFRRYHLILEADFLAAKDRTNIEIVNVPAYSPTALILSHSDLGLSPAVVVEKPEEILADKLLAFAARDYLKGRDLWDIYFLIEVQKVAITSEIRQMLEKKISDYSLDSSQFVSSFADKLKLLADKGAFLLREEMDRFLPGSYRDTFSSRYADICQQELGLLNNLLKSFKQ